MPATRSLRPSAQRFRVRVLDDVAARREGLSFAGTTGRVSSNSHSSLVATQLSTRRPGYFAAEGWLDELCKKEDRWGVPFRPTPMISMHGENLDYSASLHNRGKKWTGDEEARCFVLQRHREASWEETTRVSF